MYNQVVSFSTEGLVPKDDDTGRNFLSAAVVLVPERNRDAVIRRLSHRAGIARMTNEMYELAWATLVRTLLLLLHPVCIELIDCNERGDGRRLLAPGETIHSIPPFSKSPICDECGSNHYTLHVPVPGQIENAAKSLGLAHKVYGIWWKMSEEETYAEEQDYEFEDENDMDVDDYLTDEDSLMMELGSSMDSGNDSSDDSDDDMDDSSSNDTDYSE